MGETLNLIVPLPWFNSSGVYVQGVTDRARFIVYLGFGFGTTMSKHVQRLPSCANLGLMN
jgi:hypothetical protein